jgi:predicted dehydrogenase
MEKVRVGIVGAGPIGGLGRRENSHAGAYRRCADAELVAVADINPTRLQQFGDEWEIAPEQRYATAAEMYARAGLDIVSVTTHNLYHHQPVIEAAEAGIKVIMVEKPMAISVEWARKMIIACDRRGSRLIVEHTRRFLPHFRRLRQMVLDGAVGQVKTVSVEGCRPLLHNGTHNVDLAFYLCDAKAQRVSGFLNQEEVADPGGGGIIDCSNGVRIFVNCVAERREWFDQVVITGTAGRLQWSERTSVWTYGPLVDAPGAPYNANYVLKEIPEMPTHFETNRFFDWAARESINCLLEDRESISSGRDGLQTLEAITAMHISHQTGAWVPTPLGPGLDPVEIRSTGK